MSTDVRRISTKRRSSASKIGPGNKTSQNKEEFGKEVKTTKQLYQWHMTMIMAQNFTIEDTNLLIPKLYEAYFKINNFITLDGESIHDVPDK